MASWKSHHYFFTKKCEMCLAIVHLQLLCWFTRVVLFSHGKIWDDAYCGPVIDPSSQWLPSRHDWHPGTLHSLKLTANAPENGPGPKRKLAVQPSIFRCEPLVSGRVSNHFLMDVWWNNHFPSKGLKSSNWNNHLKVDVLGTRMIVYHQTCQSYIQILSVLCIDLYICPLN